MMDYLVGYRYHGIDEIHHYRFMADDAEHAIEQFRDAEPDEAIRIIFVVMI